jgi:hypothetical protein
VGSRDIRSVRAALKRKGYENSLDRGNRICLALAIDGKSLEIVQALVEADAKPCRATRRPTPPVLSPLWAPKNNVLLFAASPQDKFGSSLGRFGLLSLLVGSLSDTDL